MSKWFCLISSDTEKQTLFLYYEEKITPEDVLRDILPQIKIPGWKRIHFVQT